MNIIWKIVAMLLITTTLLTAYSFSDYEIEFKGIVLKKTPIKEFILGIPEYPYGKALNLRDTLVGKEVQQPADTASQRILLIGDSMLEGLMLRLKDYVAANGHDLKTVIWYSSSTLWYGSTDTLKYFIDEYKPTYIMLVLGANELFVSDIIRKRNKNVKHIIRQIDTLNYIWIGPPNWKDDTGINEMILKNVGPLHYFASKNLNYKRTSDGAHPTKASSAMWMDSIAVWVENKSYKPIRLKKPDEKARNSANVTILQPLR
ncbi:MAG: SGNH/GDSL hydrolase family protein [Bacteroidales bacterium]|nr:SGNH/GDSL hydrolase family protein [Bacteroidales bacterium]